MAGHKKPGEILMLRSDGPKGSHQGLLAIKNPRMARVS
jgi:hypothetical protein